MTIAISKNLKAEAEVDLAGLQASFEAAIVADPVSAPMRGRTVEHSTTGDLLRPVGAGIASHALILPTLCRRWVQTVGPLLLADVVGLLIAGFAARGVMNLLAQFAAAPTDWATIDWSASLMLIPLVVGYWFSGLYTEIWIHPAVELRQMTHLTSVALLAGAAGAILAGPYSIWCLVSWIVALITVPVLRTVVRFACAGRSWWGFPTLVIGSGPAADAVARSLSRDTHSGLRPVLLTDPQRICRTACVPVVNEPLGLRSIIGARMVRHAVAALPDMSASRLGQTLDRYSDMIPHVLVLSDQSTLPSLWSTSRRCGRISGIEVRNGLLLATLMIVKRLIDLSIAVTALAMSLPLLIVVTALTKFSSPGPIFFGHSRIGRHNRKFKAWKFRTMRVDGDAILRDHLAKDPAARAEWNRDHKLKVDPRVTRFGKIARILSLDELPQLWNVLIGDMSLVGPRPIVDGEVWRYGDSFRLYTSVKPGITGMWQVSGRNDIGYTERVQLDEFYIRHWSPWLDVYILAKTVVVLITRGGAY